MNPCPDILYPSLSNTGSLYEEINCPITEKEVSINLDILSTKGLLIPLLCGTV